MTEKGREPRILRLDRIKGEGVSLYERVLLVVTMLLKRDYSARKRSFFIGNIMPNYESRVT